MSDPINDIQATTSSQQADQDLLQLVSFVVGAEEYAIPILAVQEINRMMAITRVPQSPPFVEGVIKAGSRRCNESQTLSEDHGRPMV